MEQMETMLKLREAIRKLNADLETLLSVCRTGFSSQEAADEFEKNLIRAFYAEHRDMIRRMKEAGEL